MKKNILFLLIVCFSLILNRSIVWAQDMDGDFVIAQSEFDNIPPELLNMIGEMNPEIRSSIENAQKGISPSPQGITPPAPVINDSYQGPSSAKAESKKTATGEVILDVLDLKNMEITDVLKLISQKSGLNIIASQNVKGRITVFLRDIEVIDALTIIVDAYGWAYEKDKDIIKVMSAADYEAKYGHKFGHEVTTRMFRLLYALSEDVVALLNQVKTSSGKVIADEKSGMLILVDESFKLDEMEMIIKRLDVPTQSQVYHLSYATAEDLSSKITEVLTPGLGKMRFDQRSNKIIVSDTALKLKEVEDIVAAFDQRDKEVLIEAKILQITLNDEHKLGVDWQAIVSDYHNLSLKNDFSILQEGDKRGNLSIGVLANDNYTALIEALDTIGYTDILSSPSITALNNQEAKILVGSSEPYVTSSTTTPSSGAPVVAETVNFIEVGIKLFVTPTIHNDGFITMKIKPEVSSANTRLVTTNSTIPIVTTSEAETTVMVKNGVTIILGGLIEEKKVKDLNHIPVLGKIPGFKYIFGSESDDFEKTELVIFLTPRIISGDTEEHVDLSAYR